jgi:hypothetical protein
MGAEVDKFVRSCPRCGDLAAMPMSRRHGWDGSYWWVCEACRSCGPVDGSCILVQDIAEPSPPKPEAISPPEQREELTYSL